MNTAGCIAIISGSYQMDPAGMEADKHRNRKNDIPVCFPSDTVDLQCPVCVHVFADVPGLPLTAFHLHVCHTVCPPVYSVLQNRAASRLFRSVSGSSCRSGDNHLATSS